MLAAWPGRYGLPGLLAAGLITALGLPSPALAQDSLCAQVKIEIKQELTLERQAFDAEMKIANGLDTSALESVSINVSFADETGNAVRATSDPNDTSALFFIRVDNLSGIDRIDGTGRVGPATTAQINWLIIPSPGAGGTTPVGKLYLVGATLKYKLGGEEQTVTVTPDSIYVKPLPKLALDYFLTQDVYADDPFTTAVEPPEPFTLGVRIKNSGAAVARNVKIDSAQPKIVENKQGLLINFLITGSFVNDQPASNSLLIDFGNIAPAKASTGRWNMLTTLSGKFIEFSANFEHADELGGAVTSLLERTDAHLLLKDVRVDLPGRDGVRDFLARDGDVVRVYESDSGDTAVTDQSAFASLAPGPGSGTQASFNLTAPPTAGFFFVKLADPYRGGKAVGRVTRSDGKVMPAENVWFSKTLKAGGQWDYFVNFFDANSTGRYNVALAELTNGPRPPSLQFIPNRTVKEGEQVSFIVEASDPNEDVVSFSAAPLPSGARFFKQSDGVAVFDWTPTIGQAGQYPIAFSASDGERETTQVATITVQPAQPPAGPDIPTIVAPGLEADVRVLKPILLVSAPNPLDTAQKYFFEVFADESLTTLVAQGEADRKPDGTTWKLPLDLTDNTRYWWRVRASDGTTYSEWANARFFVNLANDAPGAPQPSAPRDGTEVDTTTPVLSALNSLDLDGDAVNVTFELFADAAGTQLIAKSNALPAVQNGVISWQVPQALAPAAHYWRIHATDRHGALTESALLEFTVNPSNHAPGLAAIVQPAANAIVPAGTVTLEVAGADQDGDALTYTFELDQVDSFNGPARKRFEAGSFVNVTGLPDNTRWFWRARAFDGKAEGAWVSGSFVVSSANEAPGVPVLRNLGPNSWTEARRPRLEVAAVQDPEGGPVTYEFQISADAALGSFIAEGQSTHTGWLLPETLVDGTRYYWRARTLDAEGNASDWSPAADFVVDVDPILPPRIAFSSPEDIILVEAPQVSIAYEVRDAENAARLALFYDDDGKGADGTEIVKDLAIDPSKPAGSHAWNLGALPPGRYYVYGVLANAQRTSTVYAPGVFIVPAPNARGTVRLETTTNTKLAETGLEGTYDVWLGSQPSADVTVSFNSTRPTEARVTPAQVTFTPENWNQRQTLTVKGLNDCLVDGLASFRVLSGMALSTDTDYAGVRGKDAWGRDLAYSNADDDVAAGNGPLQTCGIKLVSSKRITLTVTEYSFQVDLTNLGPAITGATGSVTSTNPNTTIVDANVTFGAVGEHATVTSQDTFSFRQDRRFPLDLTKLNWVLTPAP